MDVGAPDGNLSGVFMSDLDALERINVAIQAKRAKTSSTLLPFYVSVGNALAPARLNVRRRAAVDQNVVDDLVSVAMDI